MADTDRLYTSLAAERKRAQLVKAAIEALAVLASEKGVANGVATLDESGMIPSSQLPSYVDDAVELLDITDTAPEHCAKGDRYYDTTTGKIVRATATDTWGTGTTTNTDPEKDKIYVNIANDKSYRWTGTVMTEIGSSDITGIRIGQSGSTILPSQGVVTIPEYPDNVIEGYLNPNDGKFYAEREAVVEEEEVTGYTYSGEITGKAKAIYVELSTGRMYRFVGVGYIEVGRWYDLATPSVDGQGGSDGLMSAADKAKLNNLPAWSLAENKPSYGYSEIGYDVATAADNENTAGIVTIDGTKPLTVLTLTGDVSSLDLASGKAPEAGHSAHVIMYSASACNVSIAHDATVRVCPNGSEGMSISIVAGGYAEVDFLNAGGKIFVRCV